MHRLRHPHNIRKESQIDLMQQSVIFGWTECPSGWSIQKSRLCILGPIFGDKFGLIWQFWRQKRPKFVARKKNGDKKRPIYQSVATKNDLNL